MTVVHEIVCDYVRQHWGLVGLGFICMFFVPFNDILIPRLNGRVVAALQSGGEEPRLNQ